MKKTILFACLALVAAWCGRANAQNLLTNGNLDSNTSSAVDGWTLDETKTFSGPTTDLITLEGFIAIGPNTAPPSAADLGGFVKAFQGNGATGDLANLNMTQDVAGTPSQKYLLTGWVGAGKNYSGLLTTPPPFGGGTPTGPPTQTLLAIDFDNDNNAGNGVLGSAVKDLGPFLNSGGCCAFGAHAWSIAGVAPAGTTVVRARFSALNMYGTQNPDQAAFIDDFSLTKVPEPTTIALAAMGVIGVALLRRRHS